MSAGRARGRSRFRSIRNRVKGSVRMRTSHLKWVVFGIVVVAAARIARGMTCRPYLAWAAHASGGAATPAVIKSQCPILPVPVPYRVDVTGTGGPVAVQVYSKTK